MRKALGPSKRIRKVTAPCPFCEADEAHCKVQTPDGWVYVPCRTCYLKWRREEMARTVNAHQRSDQRRFVPPILPAEFSRAMDLLGSRWRKVPDQLRDVYFNEINGRVPGPHFEAAVRRAVTELDRMPTMAQLRLMALEVGRDRHAVHQGGRV